MQEERKRNIIEYRKFLESCDFIKVTIIKTLSCQVIVCHYFLMNYFSASGKYPVEKGSRPVRG